nr:MAG TPA: hypothetical protein [Myoviridae sp. ctfuG5]
MFVGGLPSSLLRTGSPLLTFNIYRVVEIYKLSYCYLFLLKFGVEHLSFSFEKDKHSR